MFHLCFAECLMHRLRAKEKKKKKKKKNPAMKKQHARMQQSGKEDWQRLHSSLQLARTSSSRKNPPDDELGQRCSPVGQCSGSRNSALLNYASIRFARGERKKIPAAFSRYTREIPHVRACEHACKRPGSKRVIRRISDRIVFCVLYINLFKKKKEKLDASRYDKHLIFKCVLRKYIYLDYSLSRQLKLS